MRHSTFSGTHQTILIVAITISALIGSIAGVTGAIVATGVIDVRELSGQTTADPSLRDVDKRIANLIEEESATISVVDNVAPSVVSIAIKKTLGSVYADDGFFDLYDSYYSPPESFTEAEASELIEIGGGTGFFMSSDGYIVTNRHVVSDEDASYFAVTNDGKELPATVVARDNFLDIAVLDVDGDGYPVASLGDSDGLRIGQTVIAIGNTLSEYRNTVTKGVVSGIDRRVLASDESGSDEVIEHAIQTDAAINPGNSGGPLINLLGEVVGINTAVSYEGQSVGFALPINDVKKIVGDIQAYGRIRRPWLGVWYQDVDDDLAAQIGLSPGQGVELVAGDDPSSDPAVLPDSPAEAAGLREGDVIVSVDGTAITADRTLGSIIANLEPDQTVTLSVVRDGERLDIPATLGELRNE